MTRSAVPPGTAAAQRRQLIPFAALTASYCAHAGFFNPFLPLWLKDLGLSLREIGLLLPDGDGAGLDTAQLQALAAAQVQQIDARLARLALLRSYLAPLAAGNFNLLDQDADCRFLADFLAAAPAGLEAHA